MADQPAVAQTPLQRAAAQRARELQAEAAQLPVMAFAPAHDADRDPLALLMREAEAAQTTEPGVAVAPTRRAVAAVAAPAATTTRAWNDPLARMKFTFASWSESPFLTGSATTRQAAFARLSAPNTSRSPEFLAKPAVAPAPGFQPVAHAEFGTNRFTGVAVRYVAMVPLGPDGYRVAAR
jgi:hypothetical protein